MEREFLDIAVNSYIKVFEEKKSFYNVISDNIYSLQIDKKVKNNLIAVVGSAVRHHLLYKKIFSQLGEPNNTETFYIAAVCLTDIYFTKRYNAEDVKSLALNYLKVNEPQMDIAKFEEFASLSSPNEIFGLLGLDPVKASTFSVRYNVPEWIILLWSKQYSKNLCIKTIQNLTAKRKYIAKINKMFDLEGNLRLPKEQFIPTNLDKDLLEYVGKYQPRNNKYFTENKVYLTSELENEILKKINVNYVSSCAYYFYEKNNFHIDLMNAIGSRGSIGIFFKDYNKVSKNIEYIKKYKKDNIYFAQADCDQLDVHLSNPVNLFILFANCSNFNNVSVLPEYLLNFDRNSLDLILRNEKDDLEASAKHVIMGGYLVYVTHTMNKKENNLMIEEFLKKNPNFSLVTEKEFLNLGKGSSVLGYYAILVRNL